MHTVVNIDPQILIRNKADELLEIPVIVHVKGIFNEEMVTKFEESIGKAINNDQPIIPIVIDSFGGQAYSLLAIIDMIKSCPKKVATIVIGKAMSCGAILTGFGAEGYRFAGPNATIMIHDVSCATGGKVEEMKADTNEFSRINKLLYTMLAEQIGKPKKYFLDFIHEKSHAEWYLDPKEAKSHNLINHIRIPSFEVNVTVETNFK